MQTLDITKLATAAERKVIEAQRLIAKATSKCPGEELTKASDVLNEAWELLDRIRLSDSL